MTRTRACIAGGGAAGFFAAIHCKSACPEAEVRILEKSRKLLAKVEISGGGRCNLTHACFDPLALTRFYPRGQRELLGPFHQWNPTHTVQWFEERGVRLKTEPDGRMFPVTDSSSTVVQCLVREAERVGVEIQTLKGLRSARWDVNAARFQMDLADGSREACDLLMLATGGNRESGGLSIARQFGHHIEEPVPSLFTFHINAPLLDSLSGITVDRARTAVEGTPLQQDGPLLITHWGLSGPAILKLSAWGARELAALDYRFVLIVNWLPDTGKEQIKDILAALRRDKGAQHVSKQSPFPGIPRRLWEGLTTAAGIDPATTWSQLSRPAMDRLIESLLNTRLSVTGKSMNKDEFVTCGGVSLKEVNMKTMESRVRPGLFFAGEILDVDGVTGGFNFQAAWTGGFLAGTAMAEKLRADSR
ncbi:MAG: NAD(P)/FAD-dependent oxidoreductase [Verrucomicrobia bacterium]|nr:NAD(P)/FAD-dependent oxidoreductase [Verrucomicrobiota bacterium]